MRQTESGVLLGPTQPLNREVYDRTLASIGNLLGDFGSVTLTSSRDEQALFVSGNQSLLVVPVD